MAQDFIFGNAQSVREMSAGTGKTESAFQATVIAAIAVAIAAAETFTCTVSTSGVSSQNLQNTMRVLTDANYTTSLSGSTLTISW